MRFLEEHRLTITVLTPVHIGCGEDYTPTDYVIDEDALFAFGSAALAHTLPAQAREQLNQLVQGRQQKNVLQKIQRLFYEHRETIMAKASHYLPVAPGVADLYQERIGQIAQREENNNKVINRLAIERTFYHPLSQKPIIPGSSLKGAIRTALLDQRNKVQRHRNQEKNRELQQRLFHYSAGKFELDPMRLVHLADTDDWEDEERVTSEIRFAVNRRCREPVSGKARNTMAEDKGLYQLLETLPEWGLRAYSSRLTLQKFEQLQKSDKLPTIRWTMAQIATACNAFYQPLLKQELNILGERSYAHPDWLVAMKALLDDIQPLLASKQAFLLRVGRHSGAEAVTLNGLRSIQIMQGKEKKPQYKNKPTSLWLAADTNQARSEMYPFGWLLIEINPSDALPACLLQLDEQANATGYQVWRDKQQQRIQGIQNKLTEEAKQAEEQKKEEEAKRRAEEERQRVIASMTEEQRAIYELREAFQQAKTIDTGRIKPQDQVPGRATELIKEATGWPQRDRDALGDLVMEIYEYSEMLKGKKGKERRERIAKLRG